MKRRLITGKYVEQRCECNSTWHWPNCETFRIAVKKYDSCPECGFMPWVEGDKDLALFREACLLVDSHKES